MRLSEASLERVWDNPDDAAYDLVIAVASGAASYPEVAAQLAEWKRRTA